MRFKKRREHTDVRDYGGEPLICNINDAADMNENFRFSLWTGHDMQLTLMSIPPDGEIGAEMHSDVEQLISVEKGEAKILMGSSEKELKTIATIGEGYVTVIPRGTWHNIVNDGQRPLKLYSVYAPPEHPFDTVHRTKKDSDH